MLEDDAQMDFSVKEETIVKVIIMPQEGIHVNTLTLDPSLTATLTAARKSKGPLLD